MGSFPEVSELEKDDFSELEVPGLTSLFLKKLKRWYESGCSTCVTEMLSTSSTVPPPALTSSVVLTVSDGVDNEEGVTESESDDSEAQESGEHESENECEFIGEIETAIAHEVAGNTNGKRPATGGAEAEASPKILRV